MLLEDLPGGDTRGITLVEETTTVGDATLQAGDFLFTRSGGEEDNDVRLFETIDVGAGNTSGTEKVLIEGDDVGVDITKKLRGMELIEQTTTVGGRTLNAGTILGSVSV